MHGVGWCELVGRSDSSTRLVCHCLILGLLHIYCQHHRQCLPVCKTCAASSAENTEELDHQLVTLLTILILTLVCFIHYFSRNSGLLLNLLFAVYKIVLIVIFIIVRGIAYRSRRDEPNDWDYQPVENKDALAALTYIIYSYQGWENANYVCFPAVLVGVWVEWNVAGRAFHQVGGELRVARSSLKWGAFVAVVSRRPCTPWHILPHTPLQTWLKRLECCNSFHSNCKLAQRSFSCFETFPFIPLITFCRYSVAAMDAHRSVRLWQSWQSGQAARSHAGP